MDLENEELVKNIQLDINKKENLESLWLKNLPLVDKLANKYRGISELEDVRQECFLAMKVAAETYKPDVDCKFSTWFWSVASHEVVKYINRCCSTIRLPANLGADLWRYNNLVEQFKQNENREPTDVELMVSLRCNMGHLDRLASAQATKNIDSLDAPLKSSEDESLTLADTIMDESNSFDDFMKEYDHELMANELHQTLKKLPKIQQDSIQCKFFEKKTLSEAGKKLGITGSGVGVNISNGCRVIRNTDYHGYLKKYYQDYLSPLYVSHVTTAQFLRTWTSEQELYIIRQEDRWKKEELARKIITEEAQQRREEIWKSNPNLATQEWLEQADALLSAE